MNANQRKLAGIDSLLSTVLDLFACICVYLQLEKGDPDTHHNLVPISELLFTDHKNVLPVRQKQDETFARYA